MSKKISIARYDIRNNVPLILDTNVLLHLFYPLNSPGYMQEYEKLWGKILSQRTKLLLPAIQVSEFINRCIRIQFKAYSDSQPNDYDYKKDYRNTDDYRENMTGILNIVSQEMTPYFTLINDCFNEISPEKIYIYGFSYDFNDALLVQIAEKYKANIVTHDADFANYNASIDFITNNNKLLLFS